MASQWFASCWHTNQKIHECRLQETFIEQIMIYSNGNWWILCSYQHSADTRIHTYPHLKLTSCTQKTCFPGSTTNLCLMQHRSHVLSKTAVLQHGKYDMLKTIFLRKHPVDCPSMMSLQQPFCPKSCLPGFQLTSSSSIAITTSIVAVAGAGQKGLAHCFFCFCFSLVFNQECFQVPLCNTQSRF